jgi:SulP family sulfate permease
VSGELILADGLEVFFGTISLVEDEIRKLVDLAIWQHNPIRFLIMDLDLVHGVDFSAAETFVRVFLIICGAAPHGQVGTALQGVGLWSDKEGVTVEVFASLNDTLEWTENAYL